MSPLEGLPQVTAARPFSPPLPTGTASGWLIRQEELPLTSVQILIPGGRQEETTPGLTQLSDRLLLRGAGSRGSTALALELEQRAISMSVSTGPISTAIRFDCHRRQLPVATELALDLLHRPRFEPAEVEKARKLTLGDIAQAEDQPEAVARHVADGLFMRGALRHPALGTREGVSSLHAEALRRSWETRRRGGLVVAAGDLEAPPDIELPPDKPMPLPAATAARPGLYRVDKESAPQSVIRLLMPGWSGQAPELAPARLGALALGGTFTSRLNTILREEKGWTYGARLWLEPSLGRVVFQANVVAEHTREAVDVLMEQLILAREGITETELQKAQSARCTSIVSALQSRARTAEAFAQLARQGLSPKALAHELATPCTREQVNSELARLDPDQGVLVVVCDPTWAADAWTPVRTGT